jgi:hypothetical protein
MVVKGKRDDLAAHRASRAARLLAAFERQRAIALNGIARLDAWYHAARWAEAGAIAK